MEAEDKPLRPISRRVVLCAFLGLLGPVTPSLPLLSFDTTPPPGDLRELQKRLPTHWQQGVRPHNAVQLFQELSCTGKQLEHLVLYGSHEQKGLARELLCEYLIVHANLLRDAGEPILALPLLHKAQVISQECSNTLLRAKTAYIIGFCQLDLRDQYADETRRLQETQQEAQAFLQAQHYLRHADPGMLPALETAVWAELEVTQAHLAQTSQEQREAILYIERGLLSASCLRDVRHPFFLAVNTEWVSHRLVGRMARPCSAETSASERSEAPRERSA